MTAPHTSGVRATASIKRTKIGKLDFRVRFPHCDIHVIPMVAKPPAKRFLQQDDSCPFEKIGAMRVHRLHIVEKDF